MTRRLGKFGILLLAVALAIAAAGIAISAGRRRSGKRNRARRRMIGDDYLAEMPLGALIEALRRRSVLGIRQS